MDFIVLGVFLFFTVALIVAASINQYPHNVLLQIAAGLILLILSLQMMDSGVEHKVGVSRLENTSVTGLNYINETVVYTHETSFRFRVAIPTLLLLIGAALVLTGIFAISDERKQKKAQK